MTIAPKRITNLDLLRIFSMILIVFLHSIDHSGVLENATNCHTGIFLYVQCTYFACMVCVNCYIMLSGFFLVDSKFRFNKLLILWLETVFYSFSLKLIFMLLDIDQFNIVSLLSCFFPITTGRYWFITIYVGMYLVSPFINILIHAMTRKQHLQLNICLFAIMSLWNSIHPAFAGMNSGGGWGLAWFVVLYIASSWFRLYYVPNNSSRKWFIFFFSIPVTYTALRHIFSSGTFSNTIQTILTHWIRYDSAPVYVMTICLFIAFLNIQISCKIITLVIHSIAPLTLGVYLIHSHADVSPWLWRVLDLPSKMNLFTFPIIQTCMVLLVFTVCITIEYLRKKAMSKLENGKLIRDISNKLATGSTSIFCSLFSRR